MSESASHLLRDRTGRSEIAIAIDVRRFGGNVVVVNAIRILGRRAGVAMILIEIGIRYGLPILLWSVNRKAIDEESEKRTGSTKLRKPQRLCVIMILSHRRRMSVILIERVDLDAERLMLPVVLIEERHAI